MAYIQAQSQQILRQSRMLASVASSLNAEFENRKEINKLQNELASINHTLQGYQRQQDMIVFKLLYKADSLAKDESSVPQAVAVYNNMLKYFPKSKHTQTARQRLKKIEIKKTELNRV
jgi:ABC-type microcin C transport system duplicated ATPase subunit YejF